MYLQKDGSNKAPTPTDTAAAKLPDVVQNTDVGKSGETSPEKMVTDVDQPAAKSERKETFPRVPQDLNRINVKSLFTGDDVREAEACDSAVVSFEDDNSEDDSIPEEEGGMELSFEKEEKEQETLVADERVVEDSKTTMPADKHDVEESSSSKRQVGHLRRSSAFSKVMKKFTNNGETCVNFENFIKPSKQNSLSTKQHTSNESKTVEKSHRISATLAVEDSPVMETRKSTSGTFIVSDNIVASSSTPKSSSRGKC